MTTTSLSSSMEATNEFRYAVALEEEPLEYDLSESIRMAGRRGMNLDNPSVTFARVLILGASAVYGTNFAMVKLLDEQMPLAVSAALRFGLAATVVTTLVLQGEQRHDQQQQQHQSATTSHAVTKELKKERQAATWAGMEIGGWYCLGYLCQAMGLQTADASKVC